MSPGTRATFLGRERQQDGDMLQRGGTSVWRPLNPFKKQPGLVRQTHRERCISRCPAVPVAATYALTPPARVVAAASSALLAGARAV